MTLVRSPFCSRDNVIEFRFEIPAIERTTDSTGTVFHFLTMILRVLLPGAFILLMLRPFRRNQRKILVWRRWYGTRSDNPGTQTVDPHVRRDYQAAYAGEHIFFVFNPRERSSSPINSPRINRSSSTWTLRFRTTQISSSG